MRASVDLHARPCRVSAILKPSSIYLIHRHRCWRFQRFWISDIQGRNDAQAQEIRLHRFSLLLKLWHKFISRPFDQSLPRHSPARQSLVPGLSTRIRSVSSSFSNEETISRQQTGRSDHLWYATKRISPIPSAYYSSMIETC